MPVVINEFEIVAAPEKPQPAPEEPANTTTGAGGITPRDVDVILARARERALRVRAH